MPQLLLLRNGTVTAQWQCRTVVKSTQAGTPGVLGRCLACSKCTINICCYHCATSGRGGLLALYGHIGSDRRGIKIILFFLRASEQ